MPDTLDTATRERIHTHFHGPEEADPHDFLCSDAGKILEHAAGIIQQRGKERDREQGERSMAHAVTIYRAITGATLSESHGWLFMACVKLARMQTSYNPDDTFDAVAYLALRLECLSKKGM